MTDRIILAMSGRGSNDAIRGMMQAYGDALISVGLPVVHLTHEPEELQYAARQVMEGAVGFAMTWLGIGQDLAVKDSSDGQTRNLWETFRVPLVKFQGDIPAYFPDFHGDVPFNAVNLYGAAEFLRYRRRWMAEATSIAAINPPLPLDPIDRNKVDASVRRQGKLVFLKNGNSPEELHNLWLERLPLSLAHLVLSMAEAAKSIATRPGPFHIGDFVAEHLEADGIDPQSVRYLIPFFSAQLDDYLRRIKSTMIAEAILDLPVIIQGRLWGHLDMIGRKAKLVEGQDFTKSRNIYAEALGIIDMSPNVDTSPHERVQRAAGSFALPLTNRQGWLSANFIEFEDITFEFDPESIKARVNDAISRPERYVDMGIAFGERFRDTYTPARFADCVVKAAELSNLQWAREKPLIQPFFVWPRT
jgi:hypothetical protein